MLFGSILKKRIREDKIAHIFTNSILTTIDKGFEDVACLINEAPEFTESPELTFKNSSFFTMIVIAGNLKLMSGQFNAHQENRLTDLILRDFSEVFGLNKHDFTALVNDYQSFIGKVNHPSTNILYGMSKAVFYKYELSKFQEEHFKHLNAPNPLFIKRMDEVLESFIWDWNYLKSNYNLVIN